MNSESSFESNILGVADQAYQYLTKGELDWAGTLYEQAITSEPEVLSHYA